MSRVSRSIEVEASAGRLFQCAVGAWEDGLAELGRGRSRQASSRRLILRDGCRIRYSGRPLALPDRLELEIRDLVAGVGWVAVSTSASASHVAWRWTCSPIQRTSSRLAFQFDYAPAGFGAQVMERIVGRRRRARTLTRMLARLRARAEREEALERLKRRRYELELPDRRRREEASPNTHLQRRSP